ncbi:KxYKxGKxW signal peptide domain-containing protein [Zymomonas mobilis]|nr:KxYKxGKxW signal peptide domain-containing protein [Zymomonas mobilis]
MKSGTNWVMLSVVTCALARPSKTR